MPTGDFGEKPTQTLEFIDDSGEGPTKIPAVSQRALMEAETQTVPVVKDEPASTAN